MVRAGTTLLKLPHRDLVTLPPASPRAGFIDVVDDLAEYTGLERGQVEALVHRKYEDFRTEWHAFPPAVRNEAWFYLASRTYLFANASHDGSTIAELIANLLPAPRHVLDFGGGTGNLAIALCLKGYSVDYLERSALQKDFVRFRIVRHGLQDRLRVLDQWTPLAENSYDAVCAFDVLEHIETLDETLVDLLAAIRQAGTLAEDSPFIRNVQNPMHHEGEVEFVRFMTAQGFSFEKVGESLRLWSRAAASA